MTDATVPLWICTDCLFLMANGEIGDGPRTAEEVSAAITAKWGDTEISLGSLREVCDCQSDDSPEECHPFSWQDCDTCGSTLGGDRSHATAWIQG